jgi:hypothetical protein
MDKLISFKPDDPRQHFYFSIAVLIAKLLFNLRDGNIMDVKETINELQQYSSSHLDKRHNYRNSIFIRMLEVVVDCNFDYKLINEKTRVYLQKLSKIHMYTDFTEELEVIPYERLWNQIIEILTSNKHYLHYRFYHYKEA